MLGLLRLEWLIVPAHYQRERRKLAERGTATFAGCHHHGLRRHLRLAQHPAQGAAPNVEVPESTVMVSTVLVTVPTHNLAVGVLIAMTISGPTRGPADRH